MPDMIKSQRNGFLVPTGDLDALVNAIGLALAAPESMLDAAQHYALENHNLDRMLTRTSDLYRRLPVSYTHLTLPTNRE